MAGSESRQAGGNFTADAPAEYDGSATSNKLRWRLPGVLMAISKVDNRVRRGSVQPRRGRGYSGRRGFLGVVWMGRKRVRESCRVAGLEGKRRGKLSAFASWPWALLIWFRASALYSSARSNALCEVFCSRSTTA